MNQINILDIQTRTDLAHLPLFWIGNQEHTFGITNWKVNIPGKGGIILECKTNTP